jgi:hypothetical protein
VTPHITTYTHRRVNPLAVHPTDVDIIDIAHHLSLVNRFGGATSVPISVAQHSVYVSWLCEGTDWALQGLLHDASEAYLGDVTKWLKESPEMAAYREAEDRAQEAVFLRFGVFPALSPAVLQADRLMVRFEAEQLLPVALKHIRERRPEVAHLYGAITEEERRKVGVWRPWDWSTSRQRFISRFWDIISPGYRAPLQRSLFQ